MYGLKPGVSFTEVENEGIVVDTNTGTYVSVNGTASAMLKALVAHRERESALEDLLQKLEVDREVLEQDLDSVVARLTELGLVEELPPRQESA